jgi:predicted enzyme related to lactoylglutathione lyase
MSENVKFCAAATVFVVDDIGRASSYYRDVLGFKIAFTYGEPPGYCGVERDNVIIHLFSSAGAKGPAGSGRVYIFVDDVDAYHGEVKAKGALKVVEPKDYPYGMRDFDLVDPDGNRVAFGCESKTA